MTSGVRVGALLAAFALALTGCGGGDDQPSEGTATTADGGLMGKSLEDGEAVKAVLQGDQCTDTNVAIALHTKLVVDTTGSEKLTKIAEWGCGNPERSGVNAYAMVSSWEPGEAEAAEYLRRLDSAAEVNADEARRADGNCYVINEANNWAVSFFYAPRFAMPDEIVGSEGSVVKGACEVVAE